MARSRSFSSIPMISRFHKICSFVTHGRLAFVGCQDARSSFSDTSFIERPSPSFPHPTKAILSLCWAGDETCITITRYMSSKTDRFLAHFAQLFSHRGRPEACGEQEGKSCLRKRVKINVSIFFRGDE